MSTFEGKLDEIPEISIDRFNGQNIDAEAFFLSHCHTDHMCGLGNDSFQTNLIETNRFIYVSHVSAEILKNTYEKIKNNIVELDLRSSTVVPVGNKNVTVTPIPAGHCPGSVMFLFETEKTVLYTGDYRINPSDIPKFNAFYDSMGNKKRIDAVYLDTTFFLKEYRKFPSRGESLEEICSIIKEWVQQSDFHVVRLETPAKYGYEYLFMEIHKELKMPIHVNDEIYKFYSRVPELDKAITRDGEETKIHSACGISYRYICKNMFPSYRVKHIKISAFRWTSNSLENGISEEDWNTHFVCYSTHASYEEGVGLLKFLKPKKICPNVLHKDKKDWEIYENIKENLEEEEPEPKKVKLFKVDEEKTVDKVRDKNCNNVDHIILDSPPRKFAS